LIDGFGIGGDLLEAEVPVFADFDQLDDDLVAGLVGVLQLRFVDEPGDVLREVDEDAVLDNAVHRRHVTGPFLDIVGSTTGCESLHSPLLGVVADSG